MTFTELMKQYEIRTEQSDVGYFYFKFSPEELLAFESMIRELKENDG